MPLLLIFLAASFSAVAAAEPAMKGDGSPIRYGRDGVRGKLAVGLWAHPAGIDFDTDGDTDLIVASVGRPSNGTYYFRNLGGHFAAPERWGPAKKDLVIADFNGDGRPDLVTSGGYYSDVRANRLDRWVPVSLQRDYATGRDDLWYPVDWDRDGRIDILNGVSDWRDYGWDDAFDEKGRWTRGGIEGHVYFHRNTGTNAAPVYAAPVRLPVTTEGSPSPNPVEWFKKGVWDLVLGEFIDRVLLWKNGDVSPRPLFKMDLCMIQPRTVSWHRDGRVSLLIGEEDGTVSLAENLAAAGEVPRLSPPRPLEQLDPPVKSGVLSRPVAVDWNGDGRLDLVAGNSAGYLQYFENSGTREAPAFTDRGYFTTTGGKPIRRIAGPNGSVQGPVEIKWGYANPTVADWDLDGKLDILNNDIWGSVHWYRGQAQGGLAMGPLEDVHVAWPAGAAPPKPDWVWWTPKPGQLVTQWRTTPEVVDWNRDGLPDLVMLDWRGYLSLYRRERVNGKLILHPPERIFVEPNGRFLNLARGRAGSSGRRKIELADWDGNGTLDLLVDTADGAGWYANKGALGPRTILEWRGFIVANPNLAGHNPTPNTADWNGDGKLDLIVGAEDGLFYYFERNLLLQQQPQRAQP